MTLRALVIGAGIGGLAAAHALRTTGMEVIVLERAPRLEALGAGISLWPNAVHVLRRLGLAEALDGSTLPADATVRRWDGALLSSTSGELIERRYGAPLVVLHRADLQAALLRGVNDLVRTGTEVVTVSERGGRVCAESRTGEAFEADLLIAADGIDSVVRARMLGDGAGRRSGLLAYRAVADAGHGLDATAAEYWGPGGVFGVVPIDAERIYWYATRRCAPGEPPETGRLPALLERYRGWAPDVRRTLEATPAAAILRHELLDRRPTRRWVWGRIALLGDAAHPMLPFLGQGACQALEDAGALLDAFAEVDDPVDGLAVYERRRIRRAARIVRLSRRMGRITHLRTAPLRSVRDRLTALTPEWTRLRLLDEATREGRPAEPHRGAV